MNLRKIIVLLAALGIAVAALLYFVIPRGAGSAGSPSQQPAAAAGRANPAGVRANPPLAPSPPAAGAATVRDLTTTASPPAQAPAVTASPAVAGKGSPSLTRTAEGRIAPAALADFESMPFPGGEPAYDGEKVTAYIALPDTGRKVALTVNQLGEFPRIHTKPSEQVEVRLAFTSTGPGGRVAVVPQDGGRLQGGKSSAALQVDDSRQIAFAFTVSPNPGIHRVTVTTPAGEQKTLQFWAGPPPVLMSAGNR